MKPYWHVTINYLLLGVLWIIATDSSLFSNLPDKECQNSAPVRFVSFLPPERKPAALGRSGDTPSAPKPLVILRGLSPKFKAAKRGLPLKHWESVAKRHHKK
jgi:hypothetical protein